MANKYDFDKIVDRRNTNSYKWNTPDGVLPMWVADMDFEVCPEIQEAVMKRASHGIYGYSSDVKEWADLYVNWWGNRHNWHFGADSVLFCTGVIPAISSTVRTVAKPGEGVIVFTPVYNIFFNCVRNSNRELVTSELICNSDLSYDINWEDLESKASRPDVKLLVLCNPHNPVGRIWTREELARIGDICHKNGVLVLSDEIHCDLTLPGKEYVPFASCSEVCSKISITCIAPSKTFNIAGLQSSAVVVPDGELCKKIWHGLNADEVGEGNCFAQLAAVAAFTHGGQWLDELREYIAQNKILAAEAINKIDGLQVAVTDATYLIWIDCSKLSADSGKFADFLKDEAGLFITNGGVYGANGEGFLRMNLAAPRSIVNEGLERLRRGAEAFRNL